MSALHIQCVQKKVSPQIFCIHKCKHAPYVSNKIKRNQKYFELLSPNFIRFHHITWQIFIFYKLLFEISVTDITCLYARHVLICHRLLITHSFLVISANIAITDIAQKTTFFGLHLCHRKYPCIFNHFYVIRTGSYRIRWTNEKYGLLRRLWSFKITDFGTNRKPMY